jgi:hypothetical protein
VDKRKFIRLWEGKKTVAEICHVLSISASTARRYRDRWGLNKRQQGGKCKPSFYPHSVLSAYLMGVAIGDGDLSLCGRTMRLRLFLDRKYSGLLEKWRMACRDVFVGNKIRIVRWSKNCKAIILYSNKLKEFPWKPNCGKKWEQMVCIPNWIKKDDDFMIACIRGLFESDGCAYVQRIKAKKKVYCYDRIGFNNSSELLVKDVVRFLKEHDISYTVHIRRKGDKCITRYNTDNFTIQIIDSGKFNDIVKLSKI